MTTALCAIAESMAGQALRDSQALNQRAHETAAQLHQLALSNAVALQHQFALGAARQALGAGAVEQSYQASHQRRGSEVDVQEAAAEGNVARADTAAALPQMQSQHSAVLSQATLDKISDAVTSAVLKKLADTVPPQSGAHAAEAPSSRPAG